MENAILDLFGFVRNTHGKRVCIGCRLDFSTYRNIFVHNSGCPWIRQIYELVVSPEYETCC